MIIGNKYRKNVNDIKEHIELLGYYTINIVCKTQTDTMSVFKNQIIFNYFRFIIIIIIIYLNINYH
jgi:hypothetical protein